MVTRFERLFLCLSGLLVWCGIETTSETKESLESGHGPPPAVVSEDEPVEIGLELTAANSVVGASQPLLSVTDGSVGQGRDRFGALTQFRPQGLDARDMPETEDFQASNILQPISINGRSCCQVLHEKVVDCVGREIGDDGHAKVPQGTSPPLDCRKHERRPTSLELAASSDTRLGSAYAPINDIDIAPKRFASEIDHLSPKLMEHHPGSFVILEAKLPLEEQRRHTSFVSGHRASWPEARDQRRLRIMKDSPRRSARLDDLWPRIPSGFLQPKSNGVGAHSEGERTPPASGTKPGIPDRTLRWHVQPETGRASEERADVTPPHVMPDKHLEQPDKGKPTRALRDAVAQIAGGSNQTYEGR